MVCTLKGNLFVIIFSGRFINMTSVMARWCNPCNAGYCMSKSAADTFNDVLRYEMHKWGVKVCIALYINGVSKYVLLYA